MKRPMSSQRIGGHHGTDRRTGGRDGGRGRGQGKEAGRKTEIDPESAEAFIAEKHIGERIKRLRLKKSMGLVELGRHTGLSASFLSQLETGRVVPTLRNLARIAMVFSKDLSYFFETEPSTLFRVHRKKERVRLPQSGVDDPTYYFESLGYMVPDRQLDPYYAEFIPLKKTVDVRPHVHPGLRVPVSAGRRAGDSSCGQDCTRSRQETESTSTRARLMLTVAWARFPPSP